MRGYVTDLVAALAVAVSGIGAAVAYAALIVPASLADGLPRVTMGFIIGSGLVMVIIALRSAVVPAVPAGQDGPLIVLVVLVAAMVENDPDVSATAIVVFVGLATLGTGLLMVALGRFGAGNAVRFLPATVISGFIAGTGWLLFKGGFEVMSLGPIDTGTLDELFTTDLIRQWSPGLLLGVLIYLLTSTRRVPVVASSITVLASVAIFFAVTLAFSSIDAVERGGWLIGPFADGSGPQLVTPAELGDAPWTLFGGQVAGILSVLLVGAIGLLANLSALETLTRSRIDVDRELELTGWSNILIAPIGGLVSFHALGDTVLAMRMGATRRAVAVLSGMIVLAFGLTGTDAVGYVPRFVAGGLLVAVGLGLIGQWLAEMRGPTAWADRMLSLGVLLVIALFGILEGIVVGLIAACAMFAVRYSRVDPVRRTATGVTLRSRVDRTPIEASVLSEVGERTQVFGLQGFLFFGSIVRLVDTVTQRCDEVDGSVEDVILDFRRVTGVDSGAMVLLGRLVTDLVDGGVHVAVSAAPTQLASMLAELDVPLDLAPTLDGALADVENRHLDDVAAMSAARDGTAPELGPETLSDVALAAFSRSTVLPDVPLITEGEASDVLMYLISGTASVYAGHHDAQRQRIRQFQGPSWMGEIGFLRQAPRSADVMTDTEVEIGSITRADFDALRRDQPEVVTEILADIAITLSERTTSLSSALVRALD